MQTHHGNILRPIAREKQINPFRDISIGNEGVSQNSDEVYHF
jgi:hypothetical protein